MKKALVVCGPTASGKSDVADSFAERLSENESIRVPVVSVDSMQVYKEIPVITNQPRSRPAELVGVTTVTGEWTMARHRSATDLISEEHEAPLVMDSGTGMYLNAILFDIEIYPKATKELRDCAKLLSIGQENERRASREKEIELQGIKKAGSIWEGDLRYKPYIVYIRPDISFLERTISGRTSAICSDGVQEVSDVLTTYYEEEINPSVRNAIGFKELSSFVRKDIDLEEAENAINSRTRKYAVRQIRWFDKLTRVLKHRADILTVTSQREAENLNIFA